MDLERAKEVWDEWDIHCLILLSLSLQVFLSLAADLRRRSSSRLLSNVLWLAYLSADTVAIFVLGHLAVHARGPSHELMLFWAPFVLVHLGGQDTITAFSKQDNELWTRHLLSLVTQTVVAGYVVSKSSWPDARLRAAMVLMFLCGFFKYAGRTWCLFFASPKNLRDGSMDSVLSTLWVLRRAQKHAMSGGEDEERQGQHSFDGSAKSITATIASRKKYLKHRFEVMFHADKCWEFVKDIRLEREVDEIMITDTPVDDAEITMFAEEVPDMLKDIKDRTGRCIAYQYVATRLLQSYQFLYTKAKLIDFPGQIAIMCCDWLFDRCLIDITVALAYTLFQCFFSTVTALVLFASAQKEGHHSKADITVSYILLVGAIVLDLLPAVTSILSFARKPFCPGTVDECAVKSVWSCFRPRGWLTSKQWSEELAQYSLTRRYSTSVEDYNGCMPFIRKWVLKCKPFVGDWCVEFLDLTRTPVTDDLKLFILDRLLLLQTRREEWDFASFRGERALRKWMGSHPQVQEPAEVSAYDALHKSLSSRVEFPASMFIWHIATDICYFSEGNGPDTEPDETNHNKKMSRALSHYIMYLVFKCDVLLTINSRLVHKEGIEDLTDYFGEVQLDEKEAVIKLFEALKINAMEEEAMKKEELHQSSMQGVAQDTKTNAVPANKDDGAMTSGGSRLQERLQRTMEALYPPVWPVAHAVVQELIDVKDQVHRWELISEVWLEMLFYTAPRCGAAFHYEHLSTGGEFITHVLVLMRLLGPFMPKSGA